MTENKQHSQLPNKMSEHNLKPVDQLVYAAIKAHNGSEGCFPSLETISNEINVSIPTIRKSINNLKSEKYISVTKKDRRNYYTFSKYKTFEPFSNKFLQNTNITPSTKAYLAAAQQYMFKDQEGLGKISYSNYELAEKLNVSEHFIRKCNKELERKNYLITTDNENRDLETGCKKDTKIFKLTELGQAIIWKLQEHEEQIKQNAENIEALKQEMRQKDEKYKQETEQSKKLINALQKKIEELEQNQKNLFIMR